MLGEFSREVEPHSSLDFPARNGMLLVVVSKSGSFSCHSLEDVVDKGVHDAHGLRRDASVRVDLFEHLVDVDRVALLARLSAGFFLSTGLALDSSLLFSLLGSDFARHIFQQKKVELEKVESKVGMTMKGEAVLRSDSFYLTADDQRWTDHLMLTNDVSGNVALAQFVASSAVGIKIQSSDWLLEIDP